jgi:hypothetical protein
MGLRFGLVGKKTPVGGTDRGNALKHRLSLKLSNKGNHLVPEDEKLAVDPSSLKQLPQTTTTRSINHNHIESLP